MSLRLAILCPGQGGQHAGMFELLRNDPRGAALLASWRLERYLDAEPGQVLAEPGRLFANRNAQPLIVAAQLAAWQLLGDALAAIAGPPVAVTGYSVGELSAYAIAGLYDPEQAIALAARRAALMDQAQQQAAGENADQGLMSVSGLAIDAVRLCLQRHGAFSAIETAEDTLIAGGSRHALRAAADELAGQGARIGQLPVGVASHTPLMQSAATPWLHWLEQIGASDASAPSGASGALMPRLPLLAGVTAQFVADGVQARDLLVRQLTQPIQWAACMDACAERGVTVALELGPGAALSRMLRERHQTIECRSLADFRSLAGVLAWLQRQDR